MKKFTILIIALLLFSNAFSIVPRPVVLGTKSSPSDQIIQGPCYAFATYAALESIAIQQGLFNSSNIDFYEWMAWSSQVLFGESDYIGAIIDYASTNGVYNAYGDPNSDVVKYESDLPNVGYQPMYGIAYFPDCGPSVENKIFMDNSQEGECEDYYGKEFLFEDPSGDFIKLESNGEPLYEKVYSPTDLEVKSKLNQGKGVIAKFTDWNGSGIGEHTVFIYGYSGSSYYIMDSWPGSPYKGLKTLDMSKCLSMHTINWEFENNQPDPCVGEITGGAYYIRDRDQTTYSIDRTGNTWSVSGNLSIVSQSDDQVTVKRLSCSGSTGTVYVNKSGCATKSKSINVYATPHQPTVNPSGYPTISLSLGSVLILRASNGSTGGYYWNITGSIDIMSTAATSCTVEATDLGTGNFYVKTSNECGYSANAGGTVNVTSGGGGGMMKSAKEESSDSEKELAPEEINETLPGEGLVKLFPNPVSDNAKLVYKVEEAGDVFIRIYDMSGKLIMNLVNEKKEAGVYEFEFTTDKLLSGIYIVKALISGEEESQKIIVNKFQ